MAEIPLNVEAYLQFVGSLKPPIILRQVLEELNSKKSNKIQLPHFFIDTFQSWMKCNNKGEVTDACQEGNLFRDESGARCGCRQTFREAGVSAEFTYCGDGHPDGRSDRHTLKAEHVIGPRGVLNTLKISVGDILREDKGSAYVWDPKNNHWKFETRIIQLNSLTYSSEQLQEIGVNCVPDNIHIEGPCMGFDIQVGNSLVHYGIPFKVPGSLSQRLLEGKPMIPINATVDGREIHFPY